MAAATLAAPWHAASGAVVAPGLRFRTGPHGLGGFATRDLPAGTTLLALPCARALNELTAAASDVGRAAAPLVAAHPGRLSGRSVLYLAMVADAADPAARFHEYLASLPQRFDDPLWWSERELAQLAGTNLAAGVAFKRRWLRASFDALFPALHETHPALFPRPVFTWRRFLWAHSCFSSRGFPHALSVPPGHPSEGAAAAAAPGDASGGGAEPDDVAAAHAAGPVGCMLPVLDLLNHRYRTPVEWRREAAAAAPAAASDACDGGGARVSFVTQAPIAAGEEVFNNYGPKSNEELLLSFGFVLPDNPQDTLALRLPLPPPPPPGGGGAAGTAPASPMALLAWLRLPRRFVVRAQAGATVGSTGSGGGSGGGSSGGASHEALPSLFLYDPRVVPPELLAALRLASLPPEHAAALAARAAAASASPSASDEARALLLAPLACGAGVEALALHCLRSMLLAKTRQLLAPAAAATDDDASGASGGAQEPCDRPPPPPPPDRSWLAAELRAAAAAGGDEAVRALSDAAACDGVIDVPAATEEDAATPAGAAAVAGYRRSLARTYVRGQLRLLLQLLAHVRQALAALVPRALSPAIDASSFDHASSQAAAPLSGAGAPPHAASPPSSEAPPAPLPWLPSQPGVVCRLGLGPLAAAAARSPPAFAATTTLGATLDGQRGIVTACAIPPGQPLLSLPASLLLCPANLHTLHPALCAALDSSQGLEVTPRFQQQAAAPYAAGGSSSGGSNPAHVFVSVAPEPELDRVQLALLLVAEHARGQASAYAPFIQWALRAFDAKAIEAHVARSEDDAAAGTSAVAGELPSTSSDAGAPPAAKRPRGLNDAAGGAGNAAHAAAAPASELDGDLQQALSASQLLAELHAERREQYSALLPPLVEAFPAVFPRSGGGGAGVRATSSSSSSSSSPAFGPRPCSLRAFQWAMATVEALAITLTVAGVPQLAVVPLWPRLPLLQSALGSALPGAQPQPSCVSPVWCVHAAATPGGPEAVVLGLPPAAAAGSAIPAGIPVALSPLALSLPQAGLGVPALASRVSDGRASALALAAQDVLLALGPTLSPGGAGGGAGAGDGNSDAGGSGDDGDDSEAEAGGSADVEALVAHASDAAVLRHVSPEERAAQWLA